MDRIPADGAQVRLLQAQAGPFRHEIKHEISEADRFLLRGRLRAALRVDPNGVDGCYRVRSLYFDNADDKALREKIDGAPRREKFRIRFYQGDPSRLTLEKNPKSSPFAPRFPSPWIRTFAVPCLLEILTPCEAAVRCAASCFARCARSSFVRAPLWTIHGKRFFALRGT